MTLLSLQTDLLGSTSLLPLGKGTDDKMSGKLFFNPPRKPPSLPSKSAFLKKNF